MRSMRLPRAPPRMNESRMFVERLMIMKSGRSERITMISRERYTTTSLTPGNNPNAMPVLVA